MIYYRCVACVAGIGEGEGVIGVVEGVGVIGGVEGVGVIGVVEGEEGLMRFDGGD